MATADVGATSQEAVFPPRYWWMKRVGLGFAALFVGMGVLYLGWLGVVELRYRAMIERAHARGEPILPEDFDPPEAVADERNAALRLIEAARAVNRWEAYNRRDVFPRKAEEELRLKHMLEGNRIAIHLARMARPLPDVDWKIRVGRPVADTWQDLLDSQLELASILSWWALDSHRDGNDREAFETATDILNQAAVLNRGPNLLGEVWTAEQLTEIGCKVLDELATDGCSVERASDTPAMTLLTVSTRAQFRAVIERLLDDESYRRNWVRGWHAERMEELDNARFLAGGGELFLAGGKRSGRDTFVLFRPAILLNGLRDAEDIGNAAKASSQTTESEALASYSMDGLWNSRETPPFDQLAGLPASLGARSFSWTVFEEQFRFEAARHVTALRLAIRLYRADHDGAFPARLTELVPAYLPKLPTDPFTRDGRPLRYLREPTPRAYSVGHDGVDNGGTSVVTPDENGLVGSEWDQSDAVFLLDQLQRRL